MILIKRPAVTILIGAIFGIIYGLYFIKSMALNITIMFLLILFFYFQEKIPPKLSKTALLIIFISTIFSNLYLNLLNLKYEKVYNQFPEKVNLEATIISEAKETEYYYSYNIKRNHKTFIMYVKKSGNFNLKYGMKVRIKGEYSEPEESRNYKGFNYKNFLKTKKIYGSIKVNNIEIIKENNINFILKYCNQIRNKIINTANEILPEESSSLLTGILIGEKNDISDEMKESFSESSLSHILAISGTHITYIILGITIFLTQLKVYKQTKNFLTIFFLIFFMLITGFSASVVRACIMAIIMIFAKIVHRKLDVLSSISISLLIILIYNPFSIMDIGLQLSYFGTIGIIYLNKPICNFLEKYINKKIAKILSVTISAQIMVLPIEVLNFNSISTLFLISNILAVPLTGIIILLGFSNVFIGMISIKIGKFIAIFTNFFIKCLIYIAKIISNIPFSNFLVPTPNIIIIINYYLLLFCIFKRKYIKQVVIIFILICFLSFIMGNLHFNLKINFIDVGQRRLYINRN